MRVREARCITAGGTAGSGRVLQLISRGGQCAEGLGQGECGALMGGGAVQVAGLVVTTAMNPFDVVTTRLYNQPKGEQQLYSGVWDCWKKIWKAEGMRGFSKGWFAHYARLGPHSVLSLMFLEQIRKTTAYLEEKRAERSSRRANSGSYTHHLRRVDSTQLA